MTWRDAHRRSEQLAAEAENHLRRGEASEAQQLFGAAADAEEEALGFVSRDLERTFAVLLISWAALTLRARQYDVLVRQAEDLRANALPAWAARDLDEILIEAETRVRAHAAPKATSRPGAAKKPATKSAARRTGPSSRKRNA